MHGSSFVLSYSFFYFFFVCFLFGAADCILSVAYHVNVPTSINVPRSLLEKHEFVPKSKKYEYYIYIYVYLSFFYYLQTSIVSLTGSGL